MKTKTTGYAVGILRPPRVFFFEIDFDGYSQLYLYACKYLKYFSIYKTLHGYHLIGYPFSRRVWRIFKWHFKTDFTLNLRPRWGMPRFRAQVLRISEKWNYDGDVYSPKPALVCGNFHLQNIMQYKVVYNCK